MMTDRELTPSNNQSPTTGTQVSTDVYDTDMDGLNINTNRELQIFAGVTTAFAGGTSLKVQFVESDNADLSSADVLAETAAIAEASLTAGARLLAQALPRTSKRYLGFQFVSAGTHTAGQVFAAIVCTIDDVAFPPQNTGYVA